MDASSDPLVAAQKAAKALERASGKRDEAIVAAHAAGSSYRQIAAVTGLSFQRVAQIVTAARPEPETDVAAMQARLAELDARFERLIDAVARPDLPLGDSLRRDQAAKNGQAKARRRKKLGPLPTVRMDIRAQAEAEILNRLFESPDDAYCRRVIGELGEAESLREALASHIDDDIPF